MNDLIQPLTDFRGQELPSYARLPIEVVAAAGDDLILIDGRRVLDLYGGHCVNLLGAGEEGLGESLTSQWQALSFATNLLSIPGRAVFAETLERTLPPGHWRFFLSNSGAEANENALKMALAASEGSRDTIVCFSGAFHGRTAGASALNDGLASGFPRTPFGVRRCPFGDIQAAHEAIDSRVAGVILEPLQSMAGVVEPPAGFLRGLREACDAEGALLLFDEVQSGSGRLGTTWASQHFGVIPDIFSSAKGLAGGFPMGLTLASASLAERVDASLFGSTFGGGPMALAAATEVSKCIQAPRFLQTVKERSRAFRQLCVVGPVSRVRGVGLLLGLVLKPPFQGRQVRDALLDQGILVGTSRDPRVLRLSPALNVSERAPARLARALSAIEAASKA